MPTLFDHHAKQYYEYTEIIPVSDTYTKAKAGRSLLISNDDDAVVLDPILKKEYTYISQHLERIGLNTSKRILRNNIVLGKNVYSIKSTLVLLIQCIAGWSFP